MFRKWWHWFVAVVVIVGVLAVVYSFFGRSDGLEKENLTTLLDDARSGAVDELVVDGDTVTAKRDGVELYEAQKERDVSIIEILDTSGIPVGGGDGLQVEVRSAGWNNWLTLGISFLPLLLLLAAIVLGIRWAVRR